MKELEKEILQFINELYPLNFINIQPITNEMYKCLTEQGTYFIRITNYKTYEEQLEEVTYTNFLYENGLDVPPILPSLQGNLVEKLTLDKELLQYYIKLLLVYIYQDANGILLYLKSLVNKSENCIVYLKSLKKLNRLNILTTGMRMRNIISLSIFLKKKLLLGKLHLKF